MNFSELVDELQARGHDYLSDARAGRYVNLGYTEVCEQAEFPFLLSSATGTAPLTITDVRTIESVKTSDDRKLVPIDRRHLTNWYSDLTASGTPDFYYLSGQTTVSVYPVSSVLLTVRYYRVPAELSGADTPVVPSRYHYAVVDYAVARAAADNGQPDQAEAARGEGDRLVALMAASLLDAQVDGPSKYVELVGDDN